MIEKGYGASVIGRTHLKLRKPNQDAYLIFNGEKYSLAVVCDGLGSKKYSSFGSKKLCKVIMKQIKKCFQNNDIDVSSLIPKLKINWKKSIWPIKPIKADTTCIFVVISEKNIIMCQIGDGICALKSDDQLTILSPKSDEFSNETLTFWNSFTYNWKVSIIRKEEGVNYNLLLCTDGLSEDLKLDMLSEFIDTLVDSISRESEYRNNKILLEVINNWPNKYSNDDKTMVVMR